MPNTGKTISPTPEAANETPRRDFGYRTLGLVLATIVVIALVLLFWRSCGVDTQDARFSSDEGVIQTLDDLKTVDSAVAVWLRPGTTIEQVLDRNGLADSTHTSLGDGTYVINIGDEKPRDVVARLEKDPGLYDAGFLYTDPES